MEILRPVWVEVNLDALRHNIREIKNLIKLDVKFGAVIKANAYGHGAIEVANILEEENVDYICVAGLNEAIELRKNNIKSNILVMGYIPDYGLDIAIKNNITITVFEKEQALNISDIAKRLDKIAKVHIKVDTGFNRLGFDVSKDISKDISDISKMNNIEVEGIFSHLALKSEEDDNKQIDNFKKVLDDISDLDIEIKHIVDSIGMVAYEDAHMDMVRVGASLYGYNSRKSSLNLKEVMTFKSKIVRIKSIKKGEGVGYDYSFVAPHDMKIGTVACGYSDGMPRLLSNKGYVHINNKKANILGKICMDQFVVDITDIEDIDKDTDVVCYGEDGPNLLDIANLADTNRNELLSIVSRRVPRVYTKDNKTYKVLDYLNMEEI